MFYYPRSLSVLHMELDPHLAYSIRSRRESSVWGKEGLVLELSDRAPLSSVLSVVPGRRRAGCRGSLRRLWSSWYASLSAPLSTPWLRATPSANGRRSIRRARRSEGRLEIKSVHHLQAATTTSLLSALPPG